MIDPPAMATVHELPPPAPRPSLLTRLADGYANLMSRLGTGADRATAGGYYVPPLSQQQIEAAYRSSWLTRKVHDLIPFEMTRAGRDWQAEAAQIELLEAAETSLRVWQKLCVALTTARLHGGSAIILGVLGAGSPDQELDPTRVRQNGLRWIHVASRHHLYAPQGFDSDPSSDYFGGPVMWEMRDSKANRINIHPSRVITFHGSPVPPATLALSQLDQFWGDPLLFAIKSAIDNAESSQASVATLLHELKQDVITIPGLTELIATEGAEEKLAARIKTRLMGASPGGLQSTAKGEQDDFNRMIAARQSFELAPPLARLDAVLIPSVLGSRPPEIYHVFAPLEEADPKEAADIEKLEAETVEIYTRTNHIPSVALAKAVVNRMTESGRWPGLDVSDQELQQNADDAEAQAEADRLAKQAANENTVANMQQRGTVTRDQAIELLADATPRTLYVSRKLINAAEFITWAKGQGFTTTTPADELHVTIAFSRTPVDWMKAGGDGWTGNDDGKLTVAPGGPRLVERLGDKGAVVLFFASSALAWRHEEIGRAGASFDYDEYQPHVTITYEAPADFDLRAVEPYRGKLVFGPEIFAEVVEDWEQGITER
jgi:hypothetical protein